MKKILALLMLAILSVIAGCGDDEPQTLVIPKTVALLKLTAAGTIPAGKAVAGFGASVELPAGVTVKTVAGGAVDPTVVVPSGVLAGNASIGPITYTPAAGAVKGKLDFTIASNAAAGVQLGEYVTLKFNLSGVTPTAADFTVLSFTPVDLTFAPLPTVTAATAVTLQ